MNGKIQQVDNNTSSVQSCSVLCMKLVISNLERISKNGSNKGIGFFNGPTSARWGATFRAVSEQKFVREVDALKVKLFRSNVLRLSGDCRWMASRALKGGLGVVEGMFEFAHVLLMWRHAKRVGVLDSHEKVKKWVGEGRINATAKSGGQNQRIPAGSYAILWYRIDEIVMIIPRLYHDLSSSTMPEILQLQFPIESSTFL